MISIGGAIERAHWMRLSNDRAVSNRNHCKFTADFKHWAHFYEVKYPGFLQYFAIMIPYSSKFKLYNLFFKILVQSTIFAIVHHQHEGTQIVHWKFWIGCQQSPLNHSAEFSLTQGFKQNFYYFFNWLGKGRPPLPSPGTPIPWKAYWYMHFWRWSTSVSFNDSMPRRAQRVWIKLLL